MNTENKTRRKFIKNTIAGTAALSMGGVLSGFSPKSYRNIVGANEQFRVGVMGVNSRGLALAKNFALQPNAEVVYISDVDSRAQAKCIDAVGKIQNAKPKGMADFRNALEQKDMDIMVIATPDHWHAPAAMMASEAGKHVYLEKPASHNPQEGEWLVETQKKYGNVIQMGNQRRSWPNVKEAIQVVHDGEIGNVYFAKGWYTNNRGPIGKGKEVPVPDWLDYELWQGPAPREAYRDNLIHYNWHWFWNWGTGEALNNGTHMVDLMRWGLQEKYPTVVNSVGGRYRYDDDWETPDTQVINYEFGNRSSMTWEGRSCNGRHIEGSSVGVMFYGDEGSIMIGGGNAYKIYDLKNNLVKDVKNDVKIDPRNKANPSQVLDGMHFQNFFEGIQSGASLNAGIESGHISTLLCQLGNISVRTQSTLHTDPSNGHIKGNKKARKLWSRKYEKGWKPKV
ncbi:Gfo/Idh/MocA family oxidoreductase [Membranicola marinus]|uniref:Gfo/Idh/MocA family oxidoreductase n=1 Tax=Membranihabitans marinus TaxID=1227546 RepID=A0A953HP64_9BACT|nr:Gfo/Idh/MocA family oxidoreductase [Membranihabitans marinus]MBY5958699.1 Gfo/Idh/MocA family oxidoreductase [Membranihabitans marinus]